MPDPVAPTPVPDRLAIAAQRCIPQRALSTAMHHFMASRIPWLKRAQIGVFTRLFDIDMAEAIEPNPHAYASFNDFFTRPLRDDARPIDPAHAALLSPADGTLGEVGVIHDGSALQAKGRRYRLQALLAGDANEAAAFEGGCFATVYLAPYNYHRVHAPLACRLIESRYVPGRLFNVKPTTVNGLDQLYARNERTVSLFDTDFGKLAVVMVGALFVGSVSHVWSGQVMPPRGNQVVRWPADNRSPNVAIGAGGEIGRFNMGSTVVLALAKSARWSRADWREQTRAGNTVRVGASLADLCQ